MATLLEAMTLEGRDKVPAEDVRKWIHRILKATGANERLIAHGINMAEAQFSRLAAASGGMVKASTVAPLRRLAMVVEEGENSLTPEGLRHWLVDPNPYLNDVPPILCLRSERELEKVLSVLASIRYGFPG